MAAAAGTMVVSEAAHHIHLDELVMGQNMKLRNIAKLPLPDDGHLDARISYTCWAPDSSAVLLVRTSHDEDAMFEVCLFLLHSMALSAGAALPSHSLANTDSMMSI